MRFQGNWIQGHAAIRWAAWFFAAAVLWQAQWCPGIPQRITVSGFLEDESSRPVSGKFCFRIRYYTSDTANSDDPASHPLLDPNGPFSPVLYEQDEISTKGLTPEICPVWYCTTDSLTLPGLVSDGLFALALTIPMKILILDKAWYGLELDRKGDGFDPEDVFPNLFPITSVPFSLTAQPVPFFSTCGGGGPTQIWQRMPVGTLSVTPFQSPAGGITFDTISLWLSNPQAMDLFYSVGIYDSAGQKVYGTPLLRLPPLAQGIQEAPLEGRLEPSKVYFAGFGYQGDVPPGLRNPVLVPTVKFMGPVYSVVKDGMVPTSFSIKAIQSENEFQRLTVTFINTKAIAEDARKRLRK